MERFGPTAEGSRGVLPFTGSVYPLAVFKKLRCSHPRVGRDIAVWPDGVRAAGTGNRGPNGSIVLPPTIESA